MKQDHFVIVGAGIVGLATAYALLARGIERVTVLEQEVVDHPRSTSHGASRLLRFEYGANALYSQMVILSLSRWVTLEQLTKRTLYLRTGLLLLGREDDGFTLESHRTLRALGLPTERLAEPQCRRRFPQFETHAFDLLTYNLEAGILHASTALRALKALVSEMGGTIYERTRVCALDASSRQRPLRLRLADGATISADRVVLATGPWVHRLLGELHLPVQTTRQYLLYFGGLPLSSFGVHNFPAFMANDLYGLPIHSSYSANGEGLPWLKVASHATGPVIDPDETEHPTRSQQLVRQAIHDLEELIPALRRAYLAHVGKCIYDMSPDGDFIIDLLPDEPRVAFATGLSGHGFKFGPLLGELLSSLVCGEEPLVPLKPFRLARFQERDALSSRQPGPIDQRAPR
ncbi:FAD-dependent oxidoreductase [Thermogemmatispora carboxidivorans]|uniref:FAD-dependent oxidoreductase n=1 Tax=Thermogemmatispora carboxidivorans TaxID=1382306 RepID=UPI00069B82BC|nr:FAD-dependent oxidoreductase [Thermogemmatispora carboxidivorans]